MANKAAVEALRIKGLKAKALIHLYQLEHPTHGATRIARALNKSRSAVQYHLRQMKNGVP